MKTQPLKIVAKGGLGDIIQNDVSWTVEDNKLILSSFPTLETSKKSDISYKVYVEFQTSDWSDYIGERWLTSSVLDLADENIIQKKYRNSGIIFKCFARIDNLTNSDDWRHIFIEFDTSKPIKITQ